MLKDRFLVYLKCDNKNCKYYKKESNLEKGYCMCGGVFLNNNGRCKEAPRKRYKIKGYKKTPKNIYTVKIQWDEEEIENAIKKIMRGNRSNLQLFDDAADFRRPEHIEDNIYYMSGGYQPKDSVMKAIEKGYGLPPLEEEE